MGPARITELYIELTTQCPLNCKHCSTMAGPDGSQRLPEETVLRLIEEGSSLGARRLSLSGGEPLLYPYLPQVLAAATRHGLACSLYSSGILSASDGAASIGEDVLQWLSANGVTRIVFGITGATAGVHDSITQVPGGFDAVTTSIRRAIAAGLSTEVHFVPLAPNLRQVGEVVKLAETLGVEQVSFLRAVPQGRFLEYRDELGLDYAQVAFLRRQLGAVARARTSVKVRIGAPFNCLLDRNPVPCTAGINKVLITPYGKLLPCEAFKHLQRRATSIFDRSLEDIWATDTLLNEVRHYQHDAGLCKGCAEYRYCRGGCLGQRALAGGMQLVDPYCAHAENTSVIQVNVPRELVRPCPRI